MNIKNKIIALRSNLQFDNWPITLLQRLLFRKENLIVYRNGKLAFVVDVEGGDLPGTRECMTTDMYTRYFKQLPKNRPLSVLDLGANGGGFALSLLAGGFTFSNCVCMEMNPNTFTRLQFNLNYNDRNHCRAVNAAVAGRNGFVEIRNTSGGTSESIYSQKLDGMADTLKVPLMTLDEVVDSNFEPHTLVDVCKMDIESAEYEVLESNTCQSLRRFRLLIIEIHNSDKSLDLVERISAAGFHEIVVSGKANDQNVHCFKPIFPK